MENHPQNIPGLLEPFTMIAVEGGRYDMGGESWDDDRSLPVHPVEVDDFWIGQFPVTQALWTAVMGEENNPSGFKGFARPVETISWKKINRNFLPRLNKITENTRPDSAQYRLPTEAEWEYAARGGIYWKEKAYGFSGGDVLNEVGWYNENSHEETKPVGLKLPNVLGIYDMSGNVWEWCADWHRGDYYQQCLDKGVVRNPRVAKKGALRVSHMFRGGSWFHHAQDCRTTFRPSRHLPADRSSLLGFRLVLSALPV